MADNSNAFRNSLLLAVIAGSALSMMLALRDIENHMDRLADKGPANVTILSLQDFKPVTGDDKDELLKALLKK